MADLGASDSLESIDSAFFVLSDEYRRKLCRYMITAEKSVFSTAELVDHLQAQQEAWSRDRLRVDLTHLHLPMMAEHGIIQYDRRQGTVRVDDGRFGDLCATLEAAVAGVGCSEAD
ncbi:DUF7344 domain-containing protein [Natrialbaceae archaeon A-gly3]